MHVKTCSKVPTYSYVPRGKFEEEGLQNIVKLAMYKMFGKNVQ